jgi:hypothetical protein
MGGEAERGTMRRMTHTIVRAMEVDVELLHPVVDHIHLVITHHPDR